MIPYSRIERKVYYKKDDIIYIVFYKRPLGQAVKTQPSQG